MFYWQEGEDKASTFKYMTFYIDMASSVTTVHDKHCNLGERPIDSGQIQDSKLELFWNECYVVISHWQMTKIQR